MEIFRYYSILFISIAPSYNKCLMVQNIHIKNGLLAKVMCQTTVNLHFVAAFHPEQSTGGTVERKKMRTKANMLMIEIVAHKNMNSTVSKDSIRG